MVRKKATDIKTIDKAINNINKIYENIENKTCNGCIREPKANENHPIECRICSRFYADGFKEKKDD